jgi:hypothetical protein
MGRGSEGWVMGGCGVYGLIDHCMHASIQTWSKSESTSEVFGVDAQSVICIHITIPQGLILKFTLILILIISRI